MIALVLLLLPSLALLLYLLFHLLNHVEPAHIDLNFLRQKNLYLHHVLPILESPDYKFLSRNNKKYRDYLFVHYARKLKEDINDLAGLPLGARTYLYYLLFRLFYALLILKNSIYSNAGDLRVLAGIELMLVRNAGRLA